MKDNPENIRQKLDTYIKLLNKSKSQKKKVLVVDDTRLMRFATGKVFRSAGLEVIEAENGEEGLKAALHHMPDLIVLDVIMPKMTGLEMLRALRKHPALQITPVIMLTAEKHLQTVQAILAEGVADYIVKENMEQIENRLKNYMKLM